MIDVCALIVKGLRLGLPAEEEYLFEKLEKEKIISKETKEKLKSMRGFRNILAHRYTDVDDELVFENLGSINDFRQFRKEIGSFIRKY